MSNYLLQVTPDIVSESLKVTPYSDVVFGFLIAVLVVAVGVLWWELKNERKYGKELSTQTIELLTKIENKFPMFSQIPEIRDMVRHIKESLDVHFRR